jgi:hypothetical protein
MITVSKILIVTVTFEIINSNRSRKLTFKSFTLIKCNEKFILKKYTFSDQAQYGRLKN